MEGVNPTRLDQTGWGIIFAAGADPAIEEALSPLLNFRRAQAGEKFGVYADNRFRMAGGRTGYRPGDTKATFLSRLGANLTGPVDPRRLPYYLLLVGSPDEIPYRFQTQMDVQYAVGRIHFPKLDDYAAYARSVVMAESGQVKLARRASFFGVTHPNDLATELSTTLLVQPLAEALKNAMSPTGRSTRSRAAPPPSPPLKSLLGGAQTPALLFTAGHGLRLAPNDARLRALQGALVCSDPRYAGPQTPGSALTQDYFLAGDDLAATTNLLGMIAFFFACFGAGTPLQDEFTRWERVRRGLDATGSAAFPGASAVLGTVARAYAGAAHRRRPGCCRAYRACVPEFVCLATPRRGRCSRQTLGQTTMFESAFRRLMAGLSSGVRAGVLQ